MRFVIIFVAVLCVAIASAQSDEFLDDELNAAYQLPDTIRDTAISSHRVLVDEVDQLVKGVPITVESAINGSVYSLDSLYDGRLDLQDHVINGVEGVTLSLNKILVGKQSPVKSVLDAVIPDVWNAGKYSKYMKN